MSLDDLPRILLVEDDDDTRHAVEDVLVSLGYPVETAATAGDAVGHRRLGVCPIILLDRILPDATAEEILPRIVKLAPQSSVIVLTGHGDLDSALACQRLGATDYLLKPVDSQTLVASIDRVRTARQAEKLRLQSTRLAAIADAMTGLSHESRNALQRGQASLDLLMDELSDDASAVRLVERIQAAQDDLQRLYEDVKAYAVPVRVTPAPCRVDSVLQQVWHELLAQRNGHHVSLAESQNTAMMEVSADANTLRMVFRALFENALAAGSDVSIEVSYEDAELCGKPALLIRVSDDGPGIHEDIRDQVFDEFFTTRLHGTGLGLPICRRLIEAHNGTIKLGEPASGTEIQITLPRD